MHLPLWYIRVSVDHNKLERKTTSKDDVIDQIVEPDESKYPDTTLADYIGFVQHTQEYAMPNMLIRDINEAYKEKYNDDSDSEEYEADTLGLTQKHFNFVEPIGDIDNVNFECEMKNIEVHGNHIDYIMLKSNKLGTGYNVSLLQWNDPSGESDDEGKTAYITFFVLYPQ